MRTATFTFALLLAAFCTISTASAQVGCQWKTSTYTATAVGKRFSILASDKKACQDIPRWTRDDCQRKYRGDVHAVYILATRVNKRFGKGKTCTVRYRCTIKRKVCPQIRISTRIGSYKGGYSNNLAIKKRVCKKAAREAKTKCARLGWKVASFQWSVAGFTRKFGRKTACTINYTCRFYTLTR